MMKMLIKLNKEKIKELNLENYIELTLKDAFEGRVIEEQQPDGSVLYSGNSEYPNYGGIFGEAYFTLVDDEDFMSVCEKWIWYTGYADGSEKFYEENVLKQEGEPL